MMAGNREKLDLLFSRYLEGPLDESELVELEAILLSDPEAAEHVARAALVHRQIIELINERELHQLLDRSVSTSLSMSRGFLSAPAFAGGRDSDRGRAANESAESFSRRSRWNALPGYLQALAGAAMLAAVVGLVAWGWSRPHAPQQVIASSTPAAAPEAPAPAVAEPAIVATLTRVVEGVWGPGATPLKQGQTLVEGTRVVLSSGMVKITFDCGAEVFLEGPCDFIVQSPMLGYLQSGKITASVPKRAFAFAIRAPNIDFIDLGTDFGIDVGPDGTSQLHVFEGEVIYRQDDKARKSSEVVHVTKDNAVSFGVPGTEAGNIAVDKDRFASHLALRQGARPAQPLPVEEGLALWLTADMGVSKDEQQRVVTWQDIVFGDNRSAEDAVQDDEQARPTFVADAINGRPAIRFDGNSDFLLTTPLQTTDDQTVFFVCQYSQSAYDKDRVWGGQILNYDGPPSRYLSDTLEPGVLQIGEPLLAEEFEPTLLSGQVFAGFIGAATVEAGRVDARQVGADTPVVVSYLYDYGNGRAALAIDGQVQGEAKAFAPQNVTSRKIIGRHAWMHNFFHGDLAELLIFNRALSPAEIDKVSRYLADKYQVELHPESSRGSVGAE